MVVQTTLMIAAPFFAVYPGYTGNFTVSGVVQMRAADVTSTTQTLEWSLAGIDGLCNVSSAGDDVANGCGIHVHSGTSCGDQNSVGGHYYDTTSLSADPWADVVYTVTKAVYADDDVNKTDGTYYSDGSTTVMTGLTLAEMEGRAFVVHELTSGARIACGILSSSSLAVGLTSLKRYPTFTDWPTLGYASGTVTIRAATDDSALQTLDWNLANIDPACTAGAADDVTNGCGIHVHSGTSCEPDDRYNVPAGGHYYSSDLSTDPWLDVVYVADANASTSSGSATVMTGLKLSDLVGKVFVVHQLTDGGRIACGILQAAPTMLSVSSGIVPYPGYTGDLTVSGTVTLTGDTTQTLKIDLAGLDTDCVYGAGDNVANGCGIHVHSGMSCDVADDVGGHYYSSDLSADPWSDVVYVTDSTGKNSSSQTVETGYTLWELSGRAFVIHELTTGTRIACGVLKAGEMVSLGSFSSYPGYTGSLTSVAGTVSVASSGVVSQVYSWDLTSVDTSCTDGAGDAVTNGCGVHVHSGSTCDTADDVGGHYYTALIDSDADASVTEDPDANDDPWANVVYVADSTGAAAGAAEVATGVTLPDLVGKAFVVHELNSGGRIACGIVDPTESTGGGENVASARPTTLWQLVLPGVLGLSLLMA
jgi:hypothetical protein